MLYACLADIHANLEALTAVLNDAGGRHVDKLWILGDIADYGPDPHACIEIIKRQRFTAVVGNHDIAAIGRMGTEDFHPDAATANKWTASQLQLSDVAFLESLPSFIEEDGCTLVHASPRDPVWEYMTSAQAAQENLPYFKSSFCLSGHTHKPIVYRCGEGTCVMEEFPEDSPLPLAKGRFLLNPGSVGQPRDGDPRASYAVYNSEAKTVRLLRVPYDIAATQAKMLEAKLPSNLILRLSYGI